MPWTHTDLGETVGPLKCSILNPPPLHFQLAADPHLWYLCPSPCCALPDTKSQTPWPRSLPCPLPLPQIPCTSLPAHGEDFPAHPALPCLRMQQDWWVQVARVTALSLTPHNWRLMKNSSVSLVVGAALVISMVQCCRRSSLCTFLNTRHSARVQPQGTERTPAGRRNRMRRDEAGEVYGAGQGCSFRQGILGTLCSAPELSWALAWCRRHWTFSAPDASSALMVSGHVPAI